MKLLNILETASRLKITASKVRRLVKEDRSFPCFAYSEKTIRIIEDKLDNWILLQSQKTTPILAKKEKTEEKPASKKTKPASKTAKAESASAKTTKV